MVPDWLTDEGGGEWESPACFGGGGVHLAGVDEGDVDQDALVVFAVFGGDGVGDAELLGDGGGGVGQDGERQGVLLEGEVVVALRLRRDGDEECAEVAEAGMEIAPGFELGDAVGAPAAAEELDDERAEGEEVCGVDGLAGERVLQGEVWGGGAGLQDAVFDAGGEELFDVALGDGEAFGLDEGAGVLGDGVESILERWDRRAMEGVGGGILHGFAFVGEVRGCSRRSVRRLKASVKAFLLASVASGAWPARMKPWPAPS